MNLIIKKIIKKRQTVKSYSSKKIPPRKWKQILNIIYWSPSSYGFEPYRILVINREHTLRSTIFPLMHNQKSVQEADKMIFFISLKKECFASSKWLFKRMFRNAKEVLGQTNSEAEKTTKKYMNSKEFQEYFANKNSDGWAHYQAYIALGNALNAAAILNIGSTCLEVSNKNKMEELLKTENLLKDYEELTITAAFGYPKSKVAYAHFGTNRRVRDPWNKKFTEI